MSSFINLTVGTVSNNFHQVKDPSRILFSDSNCFYEKIQIFSTLRAARSISSRDVLIAAMVKIEDEAATEDQFNEKCSLLILTLIHCDCPHIYR